MVTVQTAFSHQCPVHLVSGLRRRSSSMRGRRQILWSAWPCEVSSIEAVAPRQTQTSSSSRGISPRRCRRKSLRQILFSWCGLRNKVKVSRSESCTIAAKIGSASNDPNHSRRVAIGSRSLSRGRGRMLYRWLQEVRTWTRRNSWMQGREAGMNRR